ncbi:MAG: hypothetical protein AB1690_06760 [Candidatus Zixiibacteriota bacterium]
MRRAHTLFLIILLLTGANSFGRTLYNADVLKPGIQIDSVPYVTVAVHNVGLMALTVTNFGTIGRGSDENIPDPVTGQNIPSMNYLKGYGLNYLYEGAYWIGGRLGNDTLVSTGGGASYGVREFWPKTFPEGDIRYRSSKDPEAPEFDSSISQQDFIAVFFDTLTDVSYTGYDYYSRRFHKPMNLKITQRSYAWGYDYADDFVIFDCELGNMSFKTIEEVYIGIYLDNDIGRDYTYNSYDDICGFKATVPSRYIPKLIDTINLAWAADNDGDPDPVSGSYFGFYSPTSAAGIRFLRAPTDAIDVSFNWWISDYNPQYDWGPRRNPPFGEPFRSFDGFLGTPVGDKNKYYMMAQKEIDYDQWETRYDHSSQGWLPPPPNAAQISYGGDIKFCLSIGPFDLGPGGVAPFTFALVAGQDFHPDADFGSIGLSALWADWIFDNPGIDTDGNGYKGKFHIFRYDSTIIAIDTIIRPNDTLFDTIWGSIYVDTLYYKGDGVPDFKGAAPPPSPHVRLYPRIDAQNHGEIEVRWNGRLSETSLDQFSQQADFEGYRLYTSLTGRVYDYSMVSSYDVENFDRWEYDIWQKAWVINQQPFTRQSLRWLYGDNFNPEDYPNADRLFAIYNYETRKYDSYFFTRHDWNQSDYRDTTKIHKVYPDQPYPSTLDLDSAAMFYPNELTSEGYLKYFEYRYFLRNLLPSQQYYVSVTTFDHGFPGRKLRPLETDPTLNAQREFAQNSSELVKERGLNVVVYPNPYKLDAGYRERFEGWERPDLPAERTMAIHFTNLPNKCVIRIFTLDGDLVREIDHNFAPGQAGSMHESWDLISRNTMLVTSGIYYFSVDSEMGNQIGKLVIIK